MGIPKSCSKGLATACSVTVSMFTTAGPSRDTASAMTLPFLLRTDEAGSRLSDAITPLLPPGVNVV